MTSQLSPLCPRTVKPLCVALLLAQGVPALAQQPAERQGLIVEEVTVYAQRREQSVADVPVSISAWSGDLMERIGVRELDALSDITPGLVIQEQSPNNPGFVIRGITSDSGSAQASPRVSVYYNGADVSRSRGSYFEVFDIDRVEVVKGPQATLFGTAASVGAVSVYTRRPEPGLSAEITANAGNYSARLARGFVNAGSETLQGRLAFSYREREGFIDNIAGSEGSQNPGGFRQDDMQAIERLSIRPSIRFIPNDRVTVDLVYTWEENDDSGTSFKSGVLAPTGGSTDPFSFVEMSGSPFSEAALGAPALGIEREVEDLNLRIEWALSESMTFTSITAGRRFDSLEIFDADGTQAWFLEFAEDAEGDQFSQEFRLVTTGDRWTTIAGINYFQEDGSQRVPFNTEESIFLNCVGLLGSGLPCINPDGSVNQLTPVLTGGALSTLPYQAELTNFGDNEVLSVFADATLRVGERLELTAGLRYLTEDKTSGYSSISPASILAGVPLLLGASTEGRVLESSDSFDDWLPRFNALYSLNDTTNLYATVSKGRRSDVIDVDATVNATGEVIADVTDVPAEIVWNYEVGVKGATPGRRLRYALSTFYQDYSDFQVTQQDETGNFFTANAGSATNLGVEAEANVLLGQRVELFANFAWIDAEIDDDADNGVFAGNRFRLQPEWTAAAGAFYEQPIASGIVLTASLVWNYRSDVFFETDNLPVAGLEIAEDSFSLVNARLGLGNERAGWHIEAFANNLFDEEYLVDAGNTGALVGNPTFVAGPPLFYGVEVSWRFGD